MRILMTLLTLVTLLAHADFKELETSDVKELTGWASKAIKTCLGPDDPKQIKLGRFLNKTAQHLDKQDFTNSLKNDMKEQSLTLLNNEFTPSGNSIDLTVSSSQSESRTGYEGSYDLLVTVNLSGKDACKQTISMKKTVSFKQ